MYMSLVEAHKHELYYIGKRFKEEYENEEMIRTIESFASFDHDFSIEICCTLR